MKISRAAQRSREPTLRRAGDAAEGGAGAQQSVVATCCATAHFEVVEIAPPLGVLEAMLAAACYGERNEAPASGQGDAAAAAGYTWLELTQQVQCSNKELSAALRRLQAMEKDGRWMTLEPGAFLLANCVMMKVPGMLLTLPWLLLRSVPAQPS